MEQKQNAPLVYKAIVDKEKLKSGKKGLIAVATVPDAAIEIDFLAFNKTLDLKFQHEDPLKYEIIGPAMIPDLKLRRVDEFGEFFIYFSKDDIEILFEEFMRRGMTRNFKLGHEAKVPEPTMFIKEIWRTGKVDKTQEMGFNLPEGTVMFNTKFDSKEIYDEYIKSGKFKGFSVEIFTDAMLEFSRPERCNVTSDTLKLTQIKKMLIEEDLEDFVMPENFSLEFWDKPCSCGSCDELRKLGVCLPGVLPAEISPNSIKRITPN